MWFRTVFFVEFKYCKNVGGVAISAIKLELGLVLLKLRYKGEQERAICVAILLENEVKSAVRDLPATFKPVKDVICGKTGLNLGVKKCHIAIQLVCNNSVRQFACFLLPVYPYLKQDHGL